MVTDVKETLKDRGGKYGDFADHARITQRLKDLINEEMLKRPAGTFAFIHCEALDMIAHKIGRIINGDPNYADSWHDIAGYATLVEQRIVIK